MIRQAIRYWNTLKYLRAIQIYARLWKSVRVRFGLFRLPANRLVNSGGLCPHMPFPSRKPLVSRHDILRGRFYFLNISADLGFPVDWNAEEYPVLWRYQLHIMSYLEELEPDERWSFCRHWITSNDIGKGIGWNSYVTSLRIVNWIKASPKEINIINSLYLQCAWLYRNLENYILGNHYLENARALVMGGLFFQKKGEAAKWFQKGMQIIRNQTPEQILPDGGHFERSPMYHAIVLEIYLDILNSLGTENKDFFLFDAIRKMSDFLVSVTHPDGRIALFNDSAIGFGPATDWLLGYVKKLTGYIPRKRSEFDSSGYYIHDTDPFFLIIDGGDIGPDYLPAHAHGDIFSYELSVNKSRLVVDSGVFGYAAGEKRERMRSTKAHNTVVIDGKDQAEFWGSFRVARRYKPQSVTFDLNNTGCQFTGAFAGYAQLIGGKLEHSRSINLSSAEKLLNVEDSIAGIGIHHIESRIHLHPDAEIERLDDNKASIILNDVKCTLETDWPDFSIQKSWYYPSFGIQQENHVLILHAKTNVPVTYKYKFMFE